MNTLKRDSDQLLNAEALNQEPVDVGLFLDLLGRRFAGAVARFCFDADQDRRISALGFLQCSGVFEAVGGEDPVVMIGRRNHNSRVFCTRFDVMQRRIRIERLEFVCVVR